MRVNLATAQFPGFYPRRRLIRVFANISTFNPISIESVFFSYPVWHYPPPQGRPLLPAQDRQAHRREVQDNDQGKGPGGWDKNSRIKAKKRLRIGQRLHRGQLKVKTDARFGLGSPCITPLRPGFEAVTAIQILTRARYILTVRPRQPPTPRSWLLPQLPV